MNATERKSLLEFEGRLDAVSEIDIAWFSGWMCADGSIMYAHGKNSPPRIRFSICDIDPLERFSRLFGGSVSGPNKPSGFGRLPRYHWVITGSKALALLKRCMPYLSKRYSEKATIAFGWTPRMRGAKLSVEQVAAIKAELLVAKHGDQVRLCAKYGITAGMMSRIKTGKAWAHVIPAM